MLIILFGVVNYMHIIVGGNHYISLPSFRLFVVLGNMSIPCVGEYEHTVLILPSHLLAAHITPN